MGGVFDPQGTIALQERNLIITAVIIMLIVAIPMLIALYTFAWKYRAGNKNAKYDPDRKHAVWKELIWWMIPAAVIATIAVINWQSTHALEPSKPLVSNVPPLTIEVVALNWKWLFIYPEQNIATVNYIEFPAGTPLHFELTADAPMNSFWIPQLGSQEYAMAGMVNQLNLEASALGEFTGKASEINGEGYAGMTFTAKSTSQADFDSWVASVQQSSNALTIDSYNALAAPSEDNPPAYYSYVDQSLYGTIVMKYMMPSSSTADQTTPEMPGITPEEEAQTQMQTQTSTPMQMMPGMQM